MVNQRKNSYKKQYYVPLEINDDTIITEEYKDAPHHWSKIGNRMIETILVPVTKEQYEAYMRPEWRENKRRQRLIAKRHKREKAQEEGRDDKSVRGWDTAVSFEKLSEMGYGFTDETKEDSPEEIIVKQDLLTALHENLATLKEVDRIILKMASEGCSENVIGREVGLSQKGVNKRKHRLMEQLYERLKDYR